MRPVATLVLLGLGLALCCGHLLPPPAPRGTLVSIRVLGVPAVDNSPPSKAITHVSAATLCSNMGFRGLALFSGHVHLRLRSRMAQGGSLFPSGSRGLASSHGSARRLRTHRLHVRVLRRAAPTHVDLPLSAPRSLLPPQGLSPLRRSTRGLERTFHLGLLRPREASSAPNMSPCSIVPRGPHPLKVFLSSTKCPTDGPVPIALEAVNSDNTQAMESSVFSQLSMDVICVIKKIKINANKDGSPVVLTRKMDLSLNASAEYDCPSAESAVHRWDIFSVPSLHDVPDWSKPLDVPELQFRSGKTVMLIPEGSLTWGVYVVSFSVTVTTGKPTVNEESRSDHIYITVVRSPLEAVISGGANITIDFTDELVLDGSKSSDPDADSPLDGLHFSWYCTTNPNNYKGQKITVMSKEVCHPDQANLKWTGASDPVLALLPKMVKGDRIYFFRMVITKGDRTAFSEKTVHVLQGPRPTANIVCIENCDTILIISERFSLFLNCPSCAVSHDVFKWSILSSSGKEMPFDWVGQTATGRNSDYLSIKPFAFREFLEAEFWIALDLDTWSGVRLVLKNPFVINHAPEIGECKINPANGTAFFTKFVVRRNFKDKNIPLTYKMIVSDLHGFAKISSLKENTLGSILYMGDAPKSPPSFLPAGVLANSYGIKIYVQVYDSLGAFSQVTLYATVRAPTDKNSSKTVLHQLLNFTMGPNSAIPPLLEKRDFLSAGYLTYVVASVLNSMKTKSTLQADKARLREYLVNQTFVFPMGNLMEISQLVIAVATLTQKPSEFTRIAQKLTTVRIWEANQALQQHQQKNKHFHSEQIEILSTGILTSLSNIFKTIAHHQVFEDPFHVLESLADTILAGKVPGNETTIMWTTSFKVYVKKTEKENVTGILGNEKHCRNCFRPALNVSSVPSLLANSPISMMFCEFAEDPFPWLKSEYWEERLEKWHAHETAEALTGEAGKLPPKELPGLHKSPSKAASKRGRQLKKAESKVSRAKANTNTNANNKTSKENEGVESAEPSSQPGPPPLPTKPSIVLPRWCVYVAWFLVFATSSISSFFIVVYGLTYGYEKSLEWLFASFCSFCQSVFLVQPSKIILLSGIRLNKLKYCKNLPWVNHYRYTEITLQNMTLHPDEMRKQHDYIIYLRGTRMYQPLTEDEIRIFKRKKRLKRRALLLLIFVLTHFIFLALLLCLVALLRHTDTFYYNQFLRNRFSVDLATVTRLQDIYSWLNDVLVPLLHNSLNPTFLPESASIILGLPLMRQVRAKSGAKACLPAKNFAQTSIKGEIHCHPKYGADPEDTQNYTSSWIKISKRATDKNTQGFTYKPKEKRWPYHSHGLLHTYGSGGYAFYFFPDQEQFNSTERLKGLRSSKWLDEKTWAVIL
ncbi:polycystic kidney disease and receptor for egg jelly-related protein, partial [Pteropus vampyrus]|uniref:Polycystic kidney disease and receptor for egg jelly-related protein n=1 Tax=Pteropus vampyrus TaxID=132908 RepID=A0A6P3R013_PTEVA